jgi:hypothetical protein
MSWLVDTGSRLRGAVRVLAAGLAFLSPACAGTTVGSGVGDSFPERPPFLAGRAVTGEGNIGHLRVAYQPGDEPPSFGPSDAAGTPLAALIADMNAWLDSLGFSALVEPASPSVGRAPDVQFGCEADGFGDCVGEGAEHERDRRKRLAVTRASGDWIRWAAEAASGSDADLLLLLTIETSDYFPRQINWRGGKAIELGTGYAVSLPWLTALDRPIRVLQVTGVLMGADGRAVRIGAEGMLARPTNLFVGALGAQRIIADEDVQTLRSARRDDLPGQPLVWKVALHNLVAGLTGRVRPIAP